MENTEEQAQYKVKFRDVKKQPKMGKDKVDNRKWNKVRRGKIRYDEE